MKLVLIFGLFLLGIVCSVPRKAELLDGRTIKVYYKHTSNGPICRDSSGKYVEPYNINLIKRKQ